MGALTADGAAAAGTAAVTEADPISAERKKNLEFADWAMKKMGGNR